MDRQTETEKPKHSACRIVTAQAPLVVRAHDNLQHAAETFGTANILWTREPVRPALCQSC